LTSGYSSGSDEEEEACLQWYDIDTQEFVQLVEGEKLQLFDVREPEELEETGIIPGAVNLPRKQTSNY
jgi:rhodanese-related sulfurtransferase